MLYTTLIAATAAFSGLVAAQNGTSNSNLPPTIGACCTVNSGLVPDNLKSQWCTASTNTCPEICGGQGQIASGGNECDDDTLKYTCKCRNGTEPVMSEYEQTVPGQMCRFWHDQCINATFAANGEGNEEQQFACDTIKAAECGNKTTKDAETSSTSSRSSRPTATATGSDSGSGADETSSTPSASTASSTPGAAIRLAQDFGTPVLAGGLIALFGIAL